MKTGNSGFFRLLDANINRAMEGIRVLEETARMFFDDSVLTSALKDIRHELAQIIKKEKGLNHQMLCARESERDVLRNGETKSEQTRGDIVSVVRANAARSQEAIRTIEEYIKLYIPDLSQKFKSIRFKLYDIEKTLVLYIHSHELLKKKRLSLCVIVDDEFPEKTNMYELTREIIHGGVGTIAYRNRKSSDMLLFRCAEQMIEACRDREVTVILCDRLDVALSLQADGILLDHDSIPIKACRNIVGNQFVIGYTLPNIPHPDYGKSEGADYILIDPVFPNLQGDNENLNTLRQIVSVLSLPVIAMDIPVEYISEVLDYGVSGITCKTDGSNTMELCGKIKKYREIIDTHYAGHLN